MWIDRTKIALEKKVFRNKKFADTILLFICKTSYSQNLRAIEQIPFDFLKCLLLVKKLFRENSAEKTFLLCKQTPPTNTVNWVLR